MKPRRLALIAGRYWPLGSEGGQAIAPLAEELLRQGHDVQVVTASWEPHWPTEIVVRDVPVVRLDYPQPRWWGTLRYMQRLMRWLEAAAPSLDGVIVSGLRYEAWCACRVLPKRNVKVLLRAEGAGELGDIAWQDHVLLGHRIRHGCRGCTVLIAPTAEIENELRRNLAGVPLRRIANGVPFQPETFNPADRQAARNSLREVNHDLTLDDRAPLVLYIGRMERALGLEDLARAWRTVISHWPLARLWMIGDGPLRDGLWELITDLDLRYRLCLPGSFDDVHEILAAADVLVVPTRSGGPAVGMLQALAAGVPVVATDIPSNREVLGPAGLYVDPQKPAALAAAIEQVLQNSELAKTLIAAGRERVATVFSVEKMAAEHLAILDE